MKPPIHKHTYMRIALNVKHKIRSCQPVYLCCSLYMCENMYIPNIRSSISQKNSLSTITIKMKWMDILHTKDIRKTWTFPNWIEAKSLLFWKWMNREDNLAVYYYYNQNDWLAPSTITKLFDNVWAKMQPFLSQYALYNTNTNTNRAKCCVFTEDALDRLLCFSLASLFWLWNKRLSHVLILPLLLLLRSIHMIFVRLQLYSRADRIRQSI